MDLCVNFSSDQTSALLARRLGSCHPRLGGSALIHCLSLASRASGDPAFNLRILQVVEAWHVVETAVNCYHCMTSERVQQDMMDGLQPTWVSKA